MSRIRSIRLACAVLAFACLQGCLNAGPESKPAPEAFALSASALSGVESYGVDGEVAIYNASGALLRKSSFDGTVTNHDRVKIQWKRQSALSAQSVTTTKTSVVRQTYEPLGLLASIRDKTASISYNLQAAEANEDRVSFAIALDDDVAKKRIQTELMDELSALEADKTLLSANPKEAAAVLARAKKTLDAALSSLRVTTNCVWTADRKTWFPTRLQEDTALEYEWNGRTVTEKRAAVTNFRKNAGSDTIGGAT